MLINVDARDIRGMGLQASKLESVDRSTRGLTFSVGYGSSYTIFHFVVLFHNYHLLQCAGFLI